MKGSSLIVEQLLAFYQGSNKTAIHHGLYLLNNVICLCVCVFVYPYSGSNVYLENSACVGQFMQEVEVLYQISCREFLRVYYVCLIVLNTEYSLSLLYNMSVISHLTRAIHVTPRNQ